jgi:hypothetical protein
MSVKIAYSLVALDCPDPIALATFYSNLTGIPIEPLGELSEEELEWIELDNGGAPTLAFQRVASFVAPTWPEGAVPQQLHLDFDVDDLDLAESLALELGATKAEHQPSVDQRFRVFLDPVGHPFCFVLIVD